MPKSKLTFTFDKKPPTNTALPPVGHKAIATIKGLEAGEFISLRSLAGLVPCNESSLSNIVSSAAFDPYRIRVGNRVYYGTNASVLAYNEAMAKNQ